MPIQVAEHSWGHKGLQALANKSRFDPLYFVEHAFDWGKGDLKDFEGPDEWQKDVLRHIGEDLKKSESSGRSTKVSVATGRGVGKTALDSWLIHWYQVTHPFSNIRCTANTARQLRVVLWRELRIWLTRSKFRDHFEWTAQNLRHVDHPEWTADAVPYSKEKPESFQGQHEVRGTFVLVDEGSGIDRVLFDTADGALSSGGGLFVITGNPNNNSGFFYDTHHRFTDWARFKVSSLEAKMADRAWCDAVIKNYGKESDHVRIHVLGEFPVQAARQLISTEVVDRARERKIEKEEIADFPVYIGVDPARYGDDQTAIVVRQGHKILHTERHSGKSGPWVAKRSCEVMNQWNGLYCFVDEVGLGGPIADMIHDRGVPTIQINGQRTASKPSEYMNKRIELWDEMRRWLLDADIPSTDDSLRTDLITPQYGFNSKDQMYLEKKDDMRKRGEMSPNTADALSLTFAISDIWQFEPEDNSVLEQEEMLSLVGGDGADVVTGY